MVCQSTAVSSIVQPREIQCVAPRVCACSHWTRDICHICIDFQFDFILAFFSAFNEAHPIQYLPFCPFSTSARQYPNMRRRNWWLCIAPAAPVAMVELSDYVAL